MKVSVPREIIEGEKRVALVPDAVHRLVSSDIDVAVQSGAGEKAIFSDQMYIDSGATIVEDVKALYQTDGIVLKVQPPDLYEVELMGNGLTLIGLLNPMAKFDVVERLAAKLITSFSMDAVPRIARAQSMDALSSMASIAGYKAALIAADTLSKFLPMMITAAGTFAPAKGLVLGAGVAGLQAIATSRRLGAVMYGYDVRPSVKEQVQSLGATFVEADVSSDESEGSGGYARELAEEVQARQRELIYRSLKDVDFVISTAAVPGRPAPKLITREMIRDMRPGAVIIDVAAETGGNCELTVPGETVREGEVTIIGPLNLPSAMATHASQMYSRNISNLLLHLTSDGDSNIDFEDVISKSCCITYDGEVVYEPALTQINQRERPQLRQETTHGA